MRKLYIENLLIHGFQYFKNTTGMDDIMSKLVVYNNFCGQYYLMPIFCKKKNLSDAHTLCMDNVMDNMI